MKLKTIITGFLFFSAAITVRAGDGDLMGILENLESLVFQIAMGLATIMFIVAGILFLTSAGSPERLTKAKQALIVAIFGTLIAILSKAIVTILEQAF